MQAFTRLTSQVIPLDRANVDTDAIIPKQFLKSIRRTGFGPFLFDEWRYLDRGEPDMDCTHRPKNPEFVLNRPEYQGGQILLVRENFGCGSSREHAAWALYDYGIRVIIAPSFADIFYSNCFKNGLLAIVLDKGEVDKLFQEVGPGYKLSVDLESQTLTKPDGSVLRFAIDEALKRRLLKGLDDIALTLEHAFAIRAFEERRQAAAPWLYR
jgi:3-isopropylmalate/(R)-2-methylmalate dehydratase small subunit